MADRESTGGSGWLGFLAGVVLLAVVAFGVFAYTGGLQQQNRTADLEINMPDVKINPPDVDLPNPPPAPQVPPAAAQPAPG